MPHILFVCTGNINRSPAAEFVLNTIAPIGYTACSRALSPNAKEGLIPTKRMREAIGLRLQEEYNYTDLWSMRSKKLTAGDLELADYVFYMQPSHRKRLEQDWDYFESRGLANYASAVRIPDPQFGHVGFDHVAGLIIHCVKEFLHEEEV